jgi:hypothetical protein
MTTPITPTTTHKRKVGRRLGAIGLTVGVALALAAGVALASAPQAAEGQAEFGCTGTLVIANVECTLGVATAFDESQPTDGRAPWCGPEHDVTVYGCARDGHALVWTCAGSAPAYHPDAAAVATGPEQCESTAWIDEAIAAAASTSPNGGLCGTLTDPPPACPDEAAKRQP